MTWLSLNGDDVADMDPDATNAFMGNLRGAAADLRDAWTRDNNRIVAATRVGGGLLGKTFHELLTNKETGEFAPEKARAAVGTVPGFYASVAEIGGVLVPVYLAHDAEAARAIWASVNR